MRRKKSRVRGVAIPRNVIFVFLACALVTLFLAYTLAGSDAVVFVIGIAACLFLFLDTQYDIRKNPPTTRGRRIFSRFVNFSTAGAAGGIVLFWIYWYTLGT